MLFLHSLTVRLRAGWRVEIRSCSPSRHCCVLSITAVRAARLGVWQGPGKVALCRKCDVSLHGYDSASWRTRVRTRARASFQGLFHALR
jgi:hypothetical protein